MVDFGLSQSTSDIEGADLYQTQNGSKIYLFNCDDDRLPAAIEQGSTLREVTWVLKAHKILMTWQLVWPM